MIISEQWLRDWIDVPLDTDGLVHRLTMAGLEVDSVARAGPPLSQVVVGRIQGLQRHPGSSRLTICDVDIGQQRPLQIVCGASNATAGAKVPAALSGAILADGTRIHPATMRGIRSDAMLCSAAELGLEDSSEDLYLLDGDARIGQPVASALALDDAVIDIDLTPNRGDCLSILGVARELAVLTGAKLKLTDVPGVEAVSRTRVDVEVAEPRRCPRYLARVVEDIDIEVPAPVWMRERLRRCGIRPINVVVDVTNYVMLEIGQPMHAFDLARISGGVEVRLAGSGETLELLDGSEVQLEPGTLVVADDEGPAAVAGVMGGSGSGIDRTTRDIVLEAAHFTPAAVAGRARRLGLHTDSSFRFERGVDPALPEAAVHYASVLLADIAGGRAGPIVERTASRHLRTPRPVHIRRARAEAVLGMAVDEARMDGIMHRLSCRVVRTETGWKVVPPSYRFDIDRECDLIEELIRVIGYDDIPYKLPALGITSGQRVDSQLPLTRIRDLLVDRDYQEIITYSFVDPEHLRLLKAHDGSIALKNPIAENMAVLRTTLWPGLIQALVTNLNRQHRRLRLFEIGHTFHVDDGVRSEILRLGGAVCGNVLDAQWGQAARDVDFFDVKADVEAILALTGNSACFAFERFESEVLHPGQSASISSGRQCVGVVGNIHPHVQRRLNLEIPVFLFQLDLVPLLHRSIPKFTGLSRFPAIQRDLSVLVDNGVPSSAVLEMVRQVGGNRIVDLHLFDIYRGEGIDPLRKSLTFGLTLQDSSRTLKDEDVESTINAIIETLRQEFAAELRR